MAQYSKQYVQLFNKDFVWDFDGEECASKMRKNTAEWNPCLGLGFEVIGKNDDGVAIYGFKKEGGGYKFMTLKEIYAHHQIPFKAEKKGDDSNKMLKISLYIVCIILALLTLFILILGKDFVISKLWALLSFIISSNLLICIDAITTKTSQSDI